MEITGEEKRFIKELVRRIPPHPNASIETRNGVFVVTQAEKRRIDMIARREGIEAADLINFHLPSN